MPLKRRPQPFRLASKLLAIRQGLGLTPEQLAKKFHGLKSPPSARMVAAFEVGQLEPTLFELLAYARLAAVSTDVLIDDKLDLPAKYPERL